MLPVLMILPPPARFMAGYTALAIRNVLVKFVSRTFVHSSSARSCGGLRMLIPALLNRMSMRLNGLCHVGGDDQRGRTGRLRDQSHRLPGLRLVASQYGDRGASLGQPAGDAQPDASIAPGHDGHLASQIERVAHCFP